jgi:hypothetical protein
MLRRLRKQQRQQITIWRDPQSATGLSLPLACVCFGGPPSTWYSRYGWKISRGLIWPAALEDSADSAPAA